MAPRMTARASLNHGQTSPRAGLGASSSAFFPMAGSPWAKWQRPLRGLGTDNRQLISDDRFEINYGPQQTQNAADVPSRSGESHAHWRTRGSTEADARLG